MFFSQGTIVTDGFSMVLPPLDHHHWMIIYRSTIEIDGFSMVLPKFRCDGQRWFWPWKNQKMPVIFLQDAKDYTATCKFLV